MGISNISDHIHIKIKMPNPSQEAPVSSKVSTKDWKDMDILCTFKMKKGSKNLDHGCIRDQWPDANQNQDAKHHSGTSIVLQRPQTGLKGYWWSLHLQNQDREPRFGAWNMGQIESIRMNIKMPNPNQEPQASSKLICKGSLENGCFKDRLPWFWKMAGF